MIAIGASGTLQAVSTTNNVVNITVIGLMMNASTPPTALDYEELTSAGQQIPSPVGAVLTLTGSQSALIGRMKLYNTSNSVAQAVKLYINGTSAVNQIWAGTIPVLGSVSYEPGAGFIIRDATGRRQ